MIDLAEAVFRQSGKILSRNVFHVVGNDVPNASRLAEVRRGAEVVVEQDHRAVAFIRPSASAGRLMPEVIAALEARGSGAAMDEDFARDIEEGIQRQRQPWNPPAWD